MKKILVFSLLPLIALISACTTHVGVDAAGHPVASYDNMTGTFDGKLSGDLNSIFKATNIALERDLGYYRTGQTPSDDGWIVFARAELDLKIVVTLKKMKADEVRIAIEYGDGDLMKSQQIFNAIAKAHRALK